MSRLAQSPRVSPRVSPHESPRTLLRFSAADALFLAFILVSYPLAMAMPEAWGLENGVIENTQVVALLCGGVAAFLVWARTAARRSARWARARHPSGSSSLRAS
ncbi:hypothetical protein QPK32_16385 [Massilia sp. YIM B02763]|uniref:hypothetical protein n=1 Tax=Massilia sp. YIM B02763 TaxID=3050130 RepID=UPI0025B6D4F6|nr:hypothetical protein [Massilia sp. YIM B02763]MDN4054662.1 hypothetical protein [Massilia sp. YIM B02763]